MSKKLYEHLHFLFLTTLLILTLDSVKYIYSKNKLNMANNYIKVEIYSNKYLPSDLFYSMENDGFELSYLIDEEKITYEISCEINFLSLLFNKRKIMIKEEIHFSN